MKLLNNINPFNLAVPSLTTTTVATHHGVFHADEITAIALLSLTKTVLVSRTRDSSIINKADIVVDVGGRHGKYTKEDGSEQECYDHHQWRNPNDSELFGKSSAGLVASAYSVAPNRKEFIVAVDARDTRVNWDKEGKYEPIFNAINNCNHFDLGSKEQDELFIKMVDLVAHYLSSNIDEEVLLYELNLISYEMIEIKDKLNQERFKGMLVFAIATPPNHVTIMGAVCPDNAYVSREYLDEQGLQHAILCVYDSVQDNYSYLVNTDYIKIIDISDKIMVHPNNFMAKSKYATAVVTYTIANEDFKVARKGEFITFKSGDE